MPDTPDIFTRLASAGASSKRTPNPNFRSDSYINCLTGIGDNTRDKRESASPFVHTELTPQNFEDIYRGDDLGAVLVEALPDEMLREGWHVAIAGDEALEEEVNSYIEGLDFGPRLMEALYWSRQKGGAGILIGADDGTTDLGQPLDYTRIKSIEYFTTLTSQELFPLYYYGDPLAPKYSYPSVYFLQQLFGLPQEAISPGGQFGGYVPQSNSLMSQTVSYPEVAFKATPDGYMGKAVDKSGKRASIVSSTSPLRVVHESRFLLFDGIPVTRTQRVANQGWGDSVFMRTFEVLRDYNMSWSGICNMLSDYAQGVYKLHGLLDLMFSNDDGVVANRAIQIDMMRSLARAIVLDAGGPDQPAESFTREAVSLAGLPELMQQLALRLAAAARMPVSLLLGQSPAGLQATGDSDIRFYYDRIASYQNKLLLPNLKQLMKAVFAAKQGPTNGKEPDNWSIVFNPLWQLGSDEEADRRMKIAQADVQYISAGVVTPEEVAISRFGGDSYDGDKITIDQDARKDLGANAEEELKANAAMLQQKQGNMPDGSPMPIDPLGGDKVPKPMGKPAGPGQRPKGKKNKKASDKAHQQTAPRKPPKEAV